MFPSEAGGQDMSIGTLRCGGIGRFVSNDFGLNFGRGALKFNEGLVHVNLILFFYDSYTYKLKTIFPFAFDPNGAILSVGNDAA